MTERYFQLVASRVIFVAIKAYKVEGSLSDDGDKLAFV
jgi:hypothetical protein